MEGAWSLGVQEGRVGGVRGMGSGGVCGGALGYNLLGGKGDGCMVWGQECVVHDGVKRVCGGALGYNLLGGRGWVHGMGSGVCGT